MGIENQKEHTPETEKKERTHVAPIIDEARRIIGTYTTDTHDSEIWSEKDSTDRINAFDAKLKSGEYPSLLQLYDRNSDADRRQAERLFSLASSEKRDLTAPERKEVLATQLRVSQRETITKALEVYFQMLEMYQGMKERGVSAETTDESDVFKHLRLVREAAAGRLTTARQMYDHPTQKATLLLQAQKYDEEVVRLLICQDPGIPGHNTNGLLPVHRMMLAALKKEYEGMIAQYKTLADEGFQGAKERADRAVSAIEKAFPGRMIESLTMEEVGPILLSVGYTSVQEYKIDVAAVTAKAGIFHRIQEEGKRNVDTLANLTAALTVFQVKRLELSTIRHHFDQGYSLDADIPPLPGSTPESSIEQLREIFSQEQHGSLDSLERHLERVDNGVLHVGFTDKAETLWNDHGRIFMSRVAQTVAELETAWIPDVPGIENKDFVRDSAREFLLHENADGSPDGSLYDSLGWPRDPVTGKPKQWGDLTPGEVRNLKEKQKSCEKAINEFKGKQSLQKFSTSVQAAKVLIARKDLQSENFLSTEEIDESTLPVDVVTSENIDSLIQQYTAPIVIKMCFVQLEENAENYSKDYRELLVNFHEVVGVHLDVERYFDEFADKQFKISVNLILAALAAIVGVGAAFAVGLKAGNMAWRGTGKVLSKFKAKGATPRATSPSTPSPALVDGLEAAGQTTQKSSAVNESLTRLRYVQKERRLVEMLEKTRAGKWVSKLRFVRNSSIVQGGNKVLKYGSYPLILATGAYESYLTYERVRSAQGNDALQNEYEENYKTTALETAGYGIATFLAGFGPQAVLSAAVYKTAEYARDRSDVKTGWSRNPEDWSREFDPTGLMNELRKANLTNAVEAGGGGTLYPRIAFPSTSDQEQAIRTLDKAQVTTRKSIIEAYFLSQLPIPPEALDDTAKKILRWKINYVGFVTQNEFNEMNSSVYEEADLYAEMLLRKEAMAAEGADMIIPYTDDDGRDGIIDFSKLEIGVANRQEIMSNVSRYRMFVRPVEELILFNVQGQKAEDQPQPVDRARELPLAQNYIRHVIMSKLQHTIFKYDAYVEAIDWPGVDVPFVNDGDTNSKNVVRSFLANTIRGEVDTMIEKSMKGDLTVKEYQKALTFCQEIMQKFKNISLDSGAVTKAFEQAAHSFDSHGLLQAQKVKVNPLLELVRGVN